MFIDKDCESKIQDDLWMDQECFPETEVESLGWVQNEGRRPKTQK